MDHVPRRTISPGREREENWVTRFGDKATLCGMVRKWNVRFDGHRDPVSFVERLEELIESYRLDSDDILQALPELLQGSALLWYRSVKDSWRRYEDFRRSFELQFLPQGYQRSLDEEIRRRTQGDNEGFRDFVVALMTLMRRRGGLSLRDKLDVIFSNMKPDYKLTMRRENLFSLEEMITQAGHMETYWREKALFRPPPPPSMALMPETAYRQRNRGGKATELQEIGALSKTEDRRIIRKENTVDPEEKGKLEPRKCWNCDEAGHFSRQCDKPREMKCFNCYKKGVSTRDCGCRSGNGVYRKRDAFESKEKGKLERKCWNCDEVGHFSRQCDKPRVMKCFDCSKRGVTTRDCGCRSGNGKRTLERRATGSPIISAINTSGEWEGWLEKIAQFPKGFGLCNSEVDNRLYVDIIIEGVPCRALIDTGAMISLIGTRVANLLKVRNIQPEVVDTVIQLADGSLSEAKERFSFRGILNGKCEDFVATRVSTLMCDFLIGMDAIAQLGLVKLNVPVEGENKDKFDSDVSVVLEGAVTQPHEVTMLKEPDNNEESVTVESTEKRDADNKLVGWHKKIEEKTSDQFSRETEYAKKDGHIYRRHPCRSGGRKTDNWKMCVKPEDVLKIQNHDHQLMGHKGFKKTAARISGQYVWPKRRREVRKVYGLT